MRQCQLCGKGSIMRGKRKLLRGHYNPTKKSRKQPNLQWLTVPERKGRIKVCTKCIKGYSKGLIKIKV